MKEPLKCFICNTKDHPIAVSPDGLALAVTFHNPQFPGHTVVGPTAHRDTVEVTGAEWLAIGSIIRDLDAVQRESSPDFEKFYLVSIGDLDEGHLHFHLLVKRKTDPSLGASIFGPTGWLASRDES